MALIAEEHPKFLETPNPKKRLEFWAEAFQYVPYELAEFATRRALIESVYQPKLADIVQRIKEVATPKNDTVTDAWNALSKAAGRASVMTAEEYEKLPYEVKRFCGGRTGLLNLGMLDSEVFHSVTRGQFMRVYDSLKRARETMELMSPHLRQLAEGVIRALPDVDSEKEED